MRDLPPRVKVTVQGRSAVPFIEIALVSAPELTVAFSVVAEGVETEGQLTILKEGKCDLVQGYYFSRPLPPEEFEALIRREIDLERNGRQ